MFSDLDLPTLIADHERDAAATALHHLVHQILFGTELS